MLYGGGENMQEETQAVTKILEKEVVETLRIKVSPEGPGQVETLGKVVCIPHPTPSLLTTLTPHNHQTIGPYVST